MNELLSIDVIGFIVENIGYTAATGIGAAISWVVNKRRNSADAKAIELTNDEKVIDKWIQWSEKMEDELTEVKNEMHQQREECAKETEDLQHQIAAHEKRIFELERENDDLKKKP